ncbi:MAG TPA: L,D-transpeptidase [Bacteriovoracaceae bacterium]|nr:L,D-transpeptidase [Bacteriovoracaceae bacterium]
MKFFFLVLLLVNTAFAAGGEGHKEELDPFAPNIKQQLKELDGYYGEFETSAVADSGIKGILNACYQRTCPVFIDIDKALQMAQLFVDGVLCAEWKVSTGDSAHKTPNFDRNPNGRVYDKYSSSKFPGGDYQGLGNMPYAVFISGGFAIHGTPVKNWPKLGQPASHGCIRSHPDNAKIFNTLVRQYGVNNTWITVR